MLYKDEKLKELSFNADVVRVVIVVIDVVAQSHLNTKVKPNIGQQDICKNERTFCFNEVSLGMKISSVCFFTKVVDFNFQCQTFFLFSSFLE